MTLHFTEWQERLIFGLWMTLIVTVLIGYIINPEFRNTANELIQELGNDCSWEPDRQCPPGWL